MMIARPTRWIVSAILLFVVAGVALAASLALSLAGPNPSAQVGVPYSSGLSASGGTPPYTFAIASGSLPPGLTLSNPTTGAITGTPTTAGQYGFTASMTDSQSTDPLSPSTGPDSQAAARRRTLSESGNHGASITSPVMSITVSAAPSAAGAPTSVWTLCLMMAGLAGAGLFRLRQVRRA